MTTKTLDSLDAKLIDSESTRILPVPRCNLSQLTEWTLSERPSGITSFRVVDTERAESLIVQFLPSTPSNNELRSEIENQLLLWHSLHGTATRLRYADLSGNRPYVAFDDFKDIDLDTLCQQEGNFLGIASQLLKHVNKSIRTRLYHGLIHLSSVHTFPNTKQDLFLNYLDRFFVEQKVGEAQTVFELYRSDVTAVLGLASSLSLRSLQSETIRDFISSREQAMLKHLCKESFNQENFDDVFERWLDFFERHVESNLRKSQSIP